MGAPAGHSLLFAVGAGPPHDGVRKARRLNLSHDLAGVPPAGSGLSTRSPRPSSPQERSGVPSWGEFLVLVLPPCSGGGEGHRGVPAEAELRNDARALAQIMRTGWSTQ